MHNDDVPLPAFDIGGRRWVKDEAGFAEAITDVFEQRKRPRCPCVRGEDGKGIKMYVARIMDGYIVKRMPNTGSQHDINCVSYEPSLGPTRSGTDCVSAHASSTATAQTVRKGLKSWRTSGG
ncbi:MAG: DUF1173 family protein [Hydrogenophaga sp.]|uniref:DUF1173 family protein n=1 Tax=Hydrogenophaga sp. TaxID=1904254 RepID=UPI002719F291|nr:DUF1173 family protein [Hydrogenophaga sp.]MDO9146256.1 DUF1173 family protein [Hydrogenophaga sp.]MDO9606293.1 DUF1173 family protein [Hydrogenophaga sp.]